MSSEDDVEKIFGGALRQNPGHSLPDELKTLTTAIETLAGAIREGMQMTKNHFELLKADINGLSHKLDGKASQSSIEDLKQDLKTDSRTIQAQLQILIKNKDPAGPM